MIVQRQKEINGFKTEQYWELKTRYRDTEFLCQINRLTNEEKALKGLAYLQEKPFTILSFEQKEGKEGNPRLYDLTALQVDGNRRYSFSADQTLKLVQSLYEKKWVSYPRVDTTYLSEDLHPKIPQILKGLKAYERYTEGLLSEPIPMRKTIFDNEKISDHHAIIPTGIEPTHMTADEARIYDLIVRRFIAVFYPECKVSNTTVMGQVDELTFKTTGKQVLDKGWRVVYDELDSASAKKAETEERVLPIFKEGETGPHEPFVHQGKTSPPKPYTEATLLRAMETAGKLVEDEEMRELMKVNGIGRPSTRSAIIETLFKRKYIEKKKKNLYATETGMHLIHIIKNDLLKSPELTGQWEHKLRMMEKGQYDPSQFKAELYKMVRELTDQVIFDH
jgi:DNA topoisomerase-3